MRSRAAAALAAALLLLGACGEAPPVSAPVLDLPELTGRVVDRADLLTPAQEASLNAQSAALERDLGAQFVIATVSTLHEMPIEDYGVQLGRRWGIGREGKDDGVLLIVAPAERKARIEVGYGLEKRVTDPFAAKLMREALVPRFAEGRFGEGIEAGSRAIIARLRSKASDADIAVKDHLVT